MRLGWLTAMKDDVDAVIARDPAARSRVEVALLYPGVHAVWAHRVSHELWRRKATLPARALSQFSRFLTNVEIHPGAQIGPRLFIDHGAGVVIGETAEVGADVTVYHGVTLGGMHLDRVKRHPTVGDRVMVGAGAKILGPIEVGHDSRVGANAVLVKSVAPGSVVVGVPGQVVAPVTTAAAAAAEQDPADAAAEPVADPDPLAFAVRSLLRRVEKLEAAQSTDPDESGVHVRDDGVWEPQDYVI